MEESGNSTSRARYYLRVLRPLFYWFLFVLILYGIRTHQRLMERTRITFSGWLNGQPFAGDARLDGKAILPGDRVSLGFHCLTIADPKIEPYTTNLSIWYGGRDLGQIRLKRVEGILSVSADPVAPELSVEGEEYRITLTNSSGLNVTVPTGEYLVTARYPFSTWQDRVKVYKTGGTPLKVAPRLGALRLNCNQNGATYQLLRLNVEPMLSGDLPATITDVPENAYKVVAHHHNYEWSNMLYLKAGTTNTVDVDFEYGTAVLETTPPGASVFDPSGIERGVTPLALPELQPGSWKFILRLDNYESATATLSIAANQTNTFRANLVSQSYARAIRSTQQFLDDGKYDEAAKSAGEVLRVQPGDAAATALQTQALGLAGVDRAQALGQQGDFINAIEELTKVLNILPDNERAKQLLAEFKQHEPEQRARLEQQHIDEWTNTLNALTENIPGAASVEARELETSNAVVEVQSAIAEEFRSADPMFKLSHIGWTNEVFFMDADQEIPGGGRLCVIVGAQIKENQTRIAFKVIEFKSEALGLKILGAVLASAASTTYQSNFKPINPSDQQLSDADKNRVSEGVRLITEKIKKAIGITSDQ